MGNCSARPSAPPHQGASPHHRQRLVALRFRADLHECARARGHAAGGRPHPFRAENDAAAAWRRPEPSDRPARPTRPCVLRRGSARYARLRKSINEIILGQARREGWRLLETDVKQAFALDIELDAQGPRLGPDANLHQRTSVPIPQRRCDITQRGT